MNWLQSQTWIWNFTLSAEPQGKPKNTGVGSLSLLQQIFPTQESNQGLLHCRQILYQLSYQGSPNIKWLGSKVSLGFETSLWIFHFVMVGKVLDLSSPVTLFSFMSLLWGLTKLMHIRCLESASHNRMMAVITNSLGGKGCFNRWNTFMKKDRSVKAMTSKWQVV